MLSYPHLARVAGFLYLLLAITGYYAYYATESLLVAGDIDATADNITASISLFRTGVISHLLMSILWILLAFSFYRIFETTNRNYALLCLYFVLYTKRLGFRF